MKESSSAWHLFLALLWLFSFAQTCPVCDTWTGVVAEVCATDGITYASDCELLYTLCKEETVVIGGGANFDVNLLPIQQMIADYKLNDGPCADTGGGGNCPNCTVVVTNIPVCDSSLTEFNSSCSLAKYMCDEGIISYDDGIEFSTQTEADYRSKVASYVNWNGPCSGDCPAGLFSSDGQYGPCEQCAPGSYSANPGSSSCTLCAQDTYQPDSGALVCLPCPNGMDTLDTGADNVTLCLPDCLPGHYSSTGNAPCTQCALGTFSSAPNSIICTACGVGNFTDGKMCDECQLGSFSGAAVAPVTCEDCTAGTFSNDTGADACTSCEAGSFVGTTGARTCELCGQGTYGDVAGSPSCNQCDLGQYQIELGKEFCYKCPEGTYQPNLGMSSCIQCPKGYFQEKEGESSCTKCPEKMTTVTEGSISSLDCHYTSCEPGSKVVIVNSRVTCEACSTGFYQNAANVTFCHICPKNSYQDMQGSISCTKCPENSITYTTGSISLEDCEGPMITLYSGVNYGGTRAVLFDKRNSIASNMRGRVSSFKVNKGDWYIFTSTQYGGYKIRLNQGVVRGDTSNSNQYPAIYRMSKAAFQSIRPVVTNSMCYVDFGKYYIGYRSKTSTGTVCQNWEARTPHSSINTFTGSGIGNHNYCRNPDNDPKGPWCYTTDPNKKWDYCGVPKCKWNVDCYTEIGGEYRGFTARTAGGRTCNNWYSNWPHPHNYDNDYNDRNYGTGSHNYCRNPDPGSDNRPWCYTTYYFQRWAYCSVSKCEFSSISYF